MKFSGIPRNGLVLEVLGDGSFIDTNDGTKVAVTATNTAQNPCGIGYQKTSGFVSGSSGLITATRAASNEPVTGMMVVDFLATDNAQNKNVFGKSNVVNTDRYGPIVWMGTDGTLYAEIANASTYQRQTLGTSLEDGKWHQVKVRWDGSTFSGSLDNVEIFSVAQTLTVAYTTDNWALLNSAENSSRWCAGSARARLYNRQLSATEELSLWHEFNRKLGGGSDFGAVIPAPTGYWDFNGDATDVVTSRLSTLAGNVALTSDKFGVAGHAYGLDGNTDYIDTQEVTQLGTGDYTMEMMVYFNSLGTDDSIIIRQGTPLFVFSTEGSDSTKLDHVIYADATNNSRVTSPTGYVTTGQWYHLVITRGLSGTRMRMFKNGANKAEATVTARSNTNNNPLRFGRNHATACLDGKIGFVKFWSGVELTEAQVAQLYGQASALYPYTFRRSVLSNVIKDPSLKFLIVNGADVSGNGNNPTYVGSPVAMRAMQNDTKSYDGSTQYGYVTDTAANFVAGLSNMTAACWFKGTASGSMMIYNHWEWGPWLIKKNASNQLEVLIRTSGVNTTVTTTAVINDGKWHHIALTYDGVNMYVYLDGYLLQTQAKTGTLTHSTAGSPAYVMFCTNRQTGPTFTEKLNGQVDGQLLSARTYSLNEIRALMYGTYRN